MSPDSRRSSTPDASGTRHLSVVPPAADTDPGIDAQGVSALAPSAGRTGHAAGTRRGGRWVGVSRVCAELKVSPAEWESWRQQGATPLHLVTPDGTLLMRRAHLEAWYRALPNDDDVPPAT